MSKLGDDISLNADRGSLVIRGSLDWHTEDDFQSACRKLLDGPEDKIIVDLSAASGISSSNMSFLVNLHYWSKEKGKELVLRVGAGVGKVFERTRLKDLVGMNIETLGADQAD